MLRTWIAILLGLVVQQAGGRSDSPRSTLRDALMAVEGDSVDAARRRWSHLSQRTPPDRTALLGLGSIARHTYDYGLADSLLPRVVALRSDDVVADYARMEHAASVLLRGRLRDAAALYGEALAGAERRGDSLAMAEALLGLAVPRSRLSALPEVHAILDRVEALHPEDPLLLSNVRCQRAALLTRVGRVADARVLADTGVALARRARDARQEGRCIQAVAQTFATAGHIDSAATILGRAAPLFERSHDDAALASILQWRGYLYNTLGQHGEARRELTAAIEAGERAQALSPIGWSLINLGMVSLGMGDRVAAAEQLQRARALLQAQGDEWGVVTAQGMLGGVARAAGDVVTAERAYSEVLAWAVRSGNAQVQRNMHDALAAVSERRGEWEAAERGLKLADSIAVKHQMTGWMVGTRFRRGRLALRRGQLDVAERQFRADITKLDSSQHSLRYTTRAMLAETYAAKGALSKAEDELVAATDELDRWRASLSDRDLRVRAMEFDYGTDPDLGVATVIAALARSGRVETAFALAERRLARELTDQILRSQAAQIGATAGAPRSLTVSLAGGTRQSLVGDDAAVLEFVTGRGGEPTTLFAVTRAGIRSYQLPPIDSLESDLKRFTTVIEAAGDARPLGEKLGTALLQPGLADLDPSVTRLIIVNDDILARVPFDALILGGGQYAVERFAISLSPSVATLAALQSRTASSRPIRILSVGDPEFSATHVETEAGTPIYRSAFDSTGGLPRLTASGREAKRVARFAPRGVVRLREGASEAYVRAAPLDSFRVLHFATHALVDDEAVTRTALALAPGGGEDGFLGPADLAALDLDADLIVLSACRTAGGVVLKGEGVQGLTAPLLQAGARSVVATQWRIADASAGQLVDAFYTDLANGKSVGDALRAAKLDAIRRGAPPAEWAAFVVVGDQAVKVPLLHPPERPARLLPIALGLVGFVAVFYGWMRKRRGTEAA